GGLAQAEVGQLPDRLVGQGAAAADDADRPGLVDVAGHDADLALARRDDAGAVRPDQPARLVLERLHRPGPVEDGNALRNDDDDLDAGVRGLEDGVGGGGRRHEDHAGVGPGLPDGLGDGVEQGETLLGRAALAGHDAADDLRAVVAALNGVERAGLAEA